MDRNASSFTLQMKMVGLIELKESHRRQYLTTCEIAPSENHDRFILILIIYIFGTETRCKSVVMNGYDASIH